MGKVVTRIWKAIEPALHPLGALAFALAIAAALGGFDEWPAPLGQQQEGQG